MIDRSLTSIYAKLLFRFAFSESGVSKLAFVSFRLSEIKFFEDRLIFHKAEIT
jgi:hypothetical protein